MNCLVLFSGAGGASLGIKRAGFEIPLAVDIERDSCVSHRANFPETEVVQADLLQYDSFPKVDYVHASPPCTDLSTANTGSNKDIERGMKLVRRTCEIIEKLKPRWFSIENVPYLKHFLKWPSYELNAADYGVPQIRRRVFFTNIPRPPQTHAENPCDVSFFHEGPALKKWVSVKEALGIETGAQGKGFNLQERHNSIPNRRSIDEPSYAILTNQTNYLLAWKYAEYYAGCRTRSLDRPSPTVTTMNRGGSLGFMEEPSNTITAMEGKFAEGDRRRAGRKIGRKLEPEECAALQGFPPDFRFAGNKSSRYRQVGNAVPWQVSYAIAKQAYDSSYMLRHVGQIA